MLGDQKLCVSTSDLLLQIRIHTEKKWEESSYPPREKTVRLQSETEREKL